ncbi:MAG: hypothetical protein J6V83_04585 [Clostridia bacterium]|nr:hypothetical protein [Clostridia bacterium]
MKKFSILLTILLVLSLMMACFACSGVGNKGGSSGDKTNTDKTDKPGTMDADGFIKESTTVEAAAEELIKTILNTAKSASVNRLSSANPCVSWHIDFEVIINTRTYYMTFEMNYDIRDVSKTEIRLILCTEKGLDPIASIYFYQNPKVDNLTPGNLYLQFGESMVKVDLDDTFLGALFPISFHGNEESLISSLLGNIIQIKGDIDYRYFDGSDGKRTRKYAMQVDLKKTLLQVVNTVNSLPDSYADTGAAIKEIVAMLFSVDVTKINTQIPETTVDIKFTTKGGSRTTLGIGTLGDVAIDVVAAESDYKDSVFRGESFHANLSTKSFIASSRLIADFPSESTFESYPSFRSASLLFSGSMFHTDNPNAYYEAELGAKYDGIEVGSNQDKFLLEIVSKDGKGKSDFGVYYVNNYLVIQFKDANGDMINLECPFDTDAFITEARKNAKWLNDMDFINIVAYLLSAIQIWDNNAISFKFDTRFFSELLGMGVNDLINYMQVGYAAAGGTGTIFADQIKEKLGPDATLSDVISDHIINRTIIMILDNGQDSISIDNDLVVNVPRT